MEQAALIALVDQLRAQGREASTVEFKSNWEQANDIGEYLSALANVAVLGRHDHAYLVWDVNDKTQAVTGMRACLWSLEAPQVALWSVFSKMDSTNPIRHEARDQFVTHCVAN